MGSRKKDSTEPISPRSPRAFLNRELSWLTFARRVLELAANSEIPLLERVKFAGIVGMLHDEFFMKRVSGLKHALRKKSRKRSIDGLLPAQELAACREQLGEQEELRTRLLESDLRPALAASGSPVLDHQRLKKSQRRHLRDYFASAVLPIVTPLTVDKEHPFPFIANLSLCLAVLLDDDDERFVCVQVPSSRPRWVPLPGARGYVPLEQVIAANLDLVLGGSKPSGVYAFRVTRGAEGTSDARGELSEDEALRQPGSLVRLVSRDLKARRFAGVVRVQTDAAMPPKLQKWLARQLDATQSDVYPVASLLGWSDLMAFQPPVGDDTHWPPHKEVDHPRLAALGTDPGAIFVEIARGDILLHHPYHSFDRSVVRFIESAALDPAVLAIKLTIYRTSRDSPIVKALAEAARRGKQVAVLVEITARFDEAPNIAWGAYLEQEGVHVSYGVEGLKTHVKLALVVRDEGGAVGRYLHTGSGNYHSGTARMYEDVGLLTSDPDLCRDAATVFNALTSGQPIADCRKMLVAPKTMRKRFVQMIRREAAHAAAGKPSGIRAKMNQLQDAALIRELYAASQAGVPIRLNVRGLSCLRPGVEGLSENIVVYSALGRFLEHSRIYSFENGGEREIYIGSADWMRRNLDGRVETIVPVQDPTLVQQLTEILDVYERDNSAVWDCQPDGRYVRRQPPPGERQVAAQEHFLQAGTLRPAKSRVRSRRKTPMARTR